MTSGLPHSGSVWCEIVDACIEGPFPGVVPGFFVRDQPGCGLKHDLDDPEIIRAEGTAGLGEFHDGVGQAGGFTSVAP